MNYADFKLGTWYPKGGMVQISKAFAQVASDLGVEFYYNQDVLKIDCKDNKASSIKTKSGDVFEADIVLSGADYAFSETLLDECFRNYSANYWDSKTFAPSSLIFYLGVNRKVPKLNHHNLFFDTDFEQHASTIYDSHEWPEDPLFYVCAPSVTEKDVAPEGCENLFILIPISTDLKDSEGIHQKMYDQVMDRLEKHVGENVRDHIIEKKNFSVKEFKSEYNSYGGNAYGLANTLLQTAFLKPKMKNKKLKNMYYTGQLTTPGPGVPPSIISGEVVADLIYQEHH